MDAGHKFGLMLLYSAMGVYALLMLRILIQLFFGAAIENHQRRQWMQEHGGAAHAYPAMAGKRGWANTWLPRSTEVNLSLPKATGGSGRATLSVLVAQAIAVVFILIALGVASSVSAQQLPACDASPDLKLQLIDIQAREIRLRIRLEEIDQELKPESIERELAGIGSVHPEELRENRRKLLTIERNGLQAELDLLEEYRARIGEAIVIDEQAAALMKQERAAPPKRSPQPQMSLALRNVRRSQSILKLFGALSILMTLMGALALLLIVAARMFAQVARAKTPVAPGYSQNAHQARIRKLRKAALTLKRTEGLIV